MPVIAKRFKGLTDDFNLPAGSFGSGVSNEIVNTAANALSEATSDLTSLIKNAIPSEISDSVSMAKDAMEEYSRDIKGVAGKLIDFTKVPDSLFSNFISNITLPSGQGSRQVKQVQDLLRQCGRGSGYGFGGRPYDISLNCRGNKASLGSFGGGSGCNSSSYSNILNDLTGGGLSSAFRDISSALRALMSLAGMGYNLGLCGVFNALRGSGSIFNQLGLGNNEFSKAAGTLLGMTSQAGNVRGWMDVAIGSVGLTPMQINPSAITDMFKNFSLPEDIRETQTSQFGAAFMTSIESLDPDWTKSLEDQMPSLYQMGGSLSGFSETASAVLTDRAYGSDELDVVPMEDSDFLLMCMA